MIAMIVALFLGHALIASTAVYVMIRINRRHVRNIHQINLEHIEDIRKIEQEFEDSRRQELSDFLSTGVVKVKKNDCN